MTIQKVLKLLPVQEITASCRVLLLLTIASCNVHADSIRFGGWSHHFGDDEYNEQHNAFRYENDKWGVATGYFYNSYYDDSYFLAKQWSLPLDQYVEVKLNLGLVHGYRSCTFNSDEGSKKVCLWFPPEVRFNKVAGNPGLIFLGNGIALDLGFKW